MQRWLPQRCAEGRVNERTFERYAGIINAHLIPTIGSLKLREIRPDHIAELKVRRLGGREFAEPPSGASVAKHLNVLRRAFRDAMEAGLVTSNPVEAVSSRSTAPAHEQRALTPEEITQLVSAASGTRFDVPIRFTVATGVRQSEMLSLWWEDVQLDDALVFLRGTKTANSRRTLELSNVSVAMLRAHEQDQRARQVFPGPAWTDHGLIFPTRVGTPWPRRTPYRDYRTVVAASEILEPETVKWDTLRHSAATLWIKNGVDIFTVSRRLGHASAAFTMDRYAHLLRGQQRQAAEALDHLLS